MYQFHLDPIDPLNSAYLFTKTGANVGYIYHTANLNSTVPTWNLIWDLSDAAYCSYTGTQQVISIHASPVLPGLAWVQMQSGWIAYSPDYGTTWYRTGTRPTTRSSNKVFEMLIRPSYYSAAICFVHAYVFNETALWKTVNVGGTWDQLTDVLPLPTVAETVHCFDVPYEDNPTGQWFIYASTKANAPRNNAWVYLSQGDGTWRMDVTPAIGSTRYSCPRSSWTDYATRIVSWAGTRQNVILLGSPIDPTAAGPFVGGEVSSAPAVLFGSTNGGLSWTPFHIFIAEMGCIRWHETNVNLMYAVGGASDGYFQASNDGGLNWQTKSTSWLVLNPQPGTGFNVAAIHPVWTV